MPDRPNLLFIFTDQQSAAMLSCAGNPWLRTPAMDRLAASGVRFERAYCTHPLCMPSRFSLMTGRMPSEIGLYDNNEQGKLPPVSQHIVKQGAGWLMQKAGYESAYGGKVHLPNLSPEDLGFNYFCKDERQGLADACVDFLKQKREKPFFMVASFINPHDICYMAVRDYRKNFAAQAHRRQAELSALDEALKLPAGVSEEEFFERYCPPLPDNFAIAPEEPQAVTEAVNRIDFRQMAREHYTEKQWRLHRWAYCRLTEMVDAQIGQVLDALDSTGQADNTIVIFTSDHGDQDASHKLEHKSFFYEEGCRVPLIVRGPGVAQGQVNDSLISNGLDMLPTWCDYAGVLPPAELKGQSIRRLAEHPQEKSSRAFVPLESTVGRMIVTQRYKYMLHTHGEHREQLIDMQADPGEMKNGVNDPNLHAVLESHRSVFASW